MKKILLFGALMLVLTNVTFSQTGYWKNVTSTADAVYKAQPLPDGIKLSGYRLFNLDEAAFKNLLQQSPLQANTALKKSTFTVTIPTDDGTLQSFRIVQSPVMSAALQAKHPEITSYLGQGISDPSAIIRFNITPLGFHAIIISSTKKTIYINPVSTGNNVYVVYNRGAVTQPQQVFTCNTDKILNSDVQGVAKPFTTSDGMLRTYRFAVPTGGEFSKLCFTANDTTDAQKKASVLSVLVTDLERTNAIFETDFGIHLNYVDAEDTIIFLNKNTDPFLSNESGYDSKWGKESQQVLDSLIGTANYDIGHLLMGFNTGGNAGCIGCVCNSKDKGIGVTGFVSYLTGDPFVVDFWDHEIGHQFGGNHTFDFYYEGTGVQMEPGSGSTIMAYAGVTGNTDVQPHSDPYFHAASVGQIYTYITAGKGASCGVVTTTGDAVPTINAGKDYIIPKSTPFVLTAKAADADSTDVLTYCWEQYDNVKNNSTSNKFPKATSTTGPVFRSILPSLLNTRTFPATESILDGKNQNKWEVLPGVERTLNFRVTVRDNVPGGGSTNSDDMVITVDSSSGPFIVTYPNTSVIIGSGAVQTIRWDVANTNAAPVNCAKVNIFLSVDGGNTFPYLLRANAPNDGAQSVKFPLFDSSVNSARVKIISASNIFFDISDSDFIIQGTLPVSWLSFTAVKSGSHAALLNWSTANEVNNDHFEVERSGDAINFIKVGTVTADKTGHGAGSYAFTDNTMQPGTDFYRIRQVDKDGSFAFSKIEKLATDAAAKSWVVTPNPASDHITVTFNLNTTNAHVYFTDNTGKILYKNAMNSITAGSKITLPLSNLASGVYMLRIEAGNETRTEKIIKN